MTRTHCAVVDLRIIFVVTDIMEHQAPCVGPATAVARLARRFGQAFLSPLDN
eukprot:CAMPEP_0206429300 /NCGR_PEP_ID=MMETSP0324_2-20121206/6156_1 /ASSEMBLY_ACC=CAM_ASM_000836 /TAXON_ID=2866 /ORGANISM="Crypthecodinium cohnii, Strain Seligo" /LENGTH=51 /DNA_ID=CAMNT_0053894949 /DNA_START=28 /DNA_END=183 /DNA_ORIENTATION=-